MTGAPRAARGRARPTASRGRSGATAAGTSRTPSLREERRLLREGHRLVAGVDEVGRGALAGPVTVGVVVVDATTRTAPAGLRDSKLLTPASREALAPRLRRWAPAWAVGHAEPDEIDGIGILRALRLAGERALAQLGVAPDVVVLDGCYDWLTRPQEPEGLFSLADLPVRPAGPCPPEDGAAGRAALDVRTLVKADLRCAAVAAASVLAKTTRDALMVARHESHPGYGWATNKGYSAPEHAEALLRLGPCEQHRRSWRLPGGAPDGAALDGAALDGVALDGVALDGAALDGPALDGPALDGVALDGPAPATPLPSPPLLPAPLPPVAAAGGMMSRGGPTAPGATSEDRGRTRG